MTKDTLDEFAIAYIECALWSSIDDNDKPLDENYSIVDLSEECLTVIAADCTKFEDENLQDIIENMSQAGHDFWLTRNGHGAGFWDGDWHEEVGERLTKASKAFGEVNLYVGNNGLIYCN